VYIFVATGTCLPSRCLVVAVSSGSTISPVKRHITIFLYHLKVNWLWYTVLHIWYNCCYGIQATGFFFGGGGAFLAVVQELTDVRFYAVTATFTTRKSCQYALTVEDSVLDTRTCGVEE
jgi:hypothetical protein